MLNFEDDLLFVEDTLPTPQAHWLHSLDIADLEYLASIYNVPANVDSLIPLIEANKASTTIAKMSRKQAFLEACKNAPRPSSVDRDRVKKDRDRIVLKPSRLIDVPSDTDGRFPKQKSMNGSGIAEKGYSVSSQTVIRDDGLPEYRLIYRGVVQISIWNHFRGNPFQHGNGNIASIKYRVLPDSVWVNLGIVREKKSSNGKSKYLYFDCDVNQVPIEYRGILLNLCQRWALVPYSPISDSNLPVEYRGSYAIWQNKDLQCYLGVTLENTLQVTNPYRLTVDNRSREKIVEKPYTQVRKICKSDKQLREELKKAVAEKRTFEAKYKREREQANQYYSLLREHGEVYCVVDRGFPNAEISVVGDRSSLKGQRVLWQGTQDQCYTFIRESKLLGRWITP